MGDSLLGDKTHSMIFDNSKIKSFVPDFSCTIPFSQGALEIAEWYKKNPNFGTVDSTIDAAFDAIIARMGL